MSNVKDGDKSLGTVAAIIIMLLNIYSWLIVIYILMSWIPNARESGLGQMLGQIVEPYLEPFRKIIPPIGMLDISPIFAFLALRFAEVGVKAIFNMLM